MSTSAKTEREIQDLLLDLSSLEPNMALDILDAFQAGSEKIGEGISNELLARLRELTKEDAEHVVLSLTTDSDGWRHIGWGPR